MAGMKPAAHQRKNPAELPDGQVEQRGRNREEAVKEWVDINLSVSDVKKKSEKN
jgi:hypothetical protein